MELFPTQGPMIRLTTIRIRAVDHLNLRPVGGFNGALDRKPLLTRAADQVGRFNPHGISGGAWLSFGLSEQRLSRCCRHRESGPAVRAQRHDLTVTAKDNFEWSGADGHGGRSTLASSASSIVAATLTTDEAVINQNYDLSRRSCGTRNGLLLVVPRLKPLPRTANRPQTWLFVAFPQVRNPAPSRVREM